MTEEFPLSWQLGILALLLVLSAFFSIAETSMMAINRYRLKAMVRMGSRGAKRTSELLAKTDKLLGVILLGNNLVNIVASAFVTGVLVDLFGDAGVAYAAVVMTVMFVIFGEILPKTLALNRPVRTILAFVSFVDWTFRLLSPVSRMMQWVVKHVLTAFGAGAVARSAQGAEEVAAGQRGVARHGQIR